MSRRFRLIVFVGLSGLIVLIGLIGYPRKSDFLGFLGSRTSEDGIDRSDATETDAAADSADSPQAAAQASSARSEQAKADLQPQPAAGRYVNSQFGFSFEKPKGYTVGVIPGEDGGSADSPQGSQILLVQATSQDGFQIYITPLDEPVELTPERIRQDIPDLTISNPKKVVLDTAEGILFQSNNAAFGGKSQELWVTYRGNLYQISGYAEGAEEMLAIVGTWKFQ